MANYTARMRIFVLPNEVLFVFKIHDGVVIFSLLGTGQRKKHSEPKNHIAIQEYNAAFLYPPSS